MTSIEILDKKNQLIQRNASIISEAKKEVRELTQEENDEFTKNEEEIRSLEAAEKELDKELEIIDENKNKNTNKTISRNMKKENLLLNEIVKRMENGDSSAFTVSRAYEITGASGEGEDLVQTDVLDLWEPLKSNNVLADSGVQIFTNLHGDVQIPLYSGSNVSFVGEKANASDGSGTFTSVSMTPHRISGVYPITLQFAKQCGDDVLPKVMNGIANSVLEKVQAEMLSNNAGTSVKPSGLAYNVAAVDIANYEDLTDFEAGMEEKKFNDFKFILSPKSKAALKRMIKGTNNTGMVYDGGEVDGYPAAWTQDVAANKGLVADWSNVVLGLWGDPLISVVADTQSLTAGSFNIIVNAFVDWKAVREDSVAVINTYTTA